MWAQLKRLSILFFISLWLLNGSLMADWNKQFDEQTRLLIQELPQFQDSSYLKKRKQFLLARREILKDTEMRNKFLSASQEDKFMLHREDLAMILKKRKNDRMHDLYPWELSYLLGSSAYMLPSFPIEMGGKKIIIQELEEFEFGKVISESYPKKGFPKEIVDKVSLETYWKAHLQAYILGLGDLVVQNIGVSPSGIIRFFDNESSIGYRNYIVKTDTGFKASFQCESFDWPQFRADLDKKTARKIKAYLQGFVGFEDRLKIYLQHRPIDFDINGILERLEHVRNFEIKEGVSFRDFYGSLHPKLSRGLKDLNHIVQSILKRKVGYGASLLFMSRWINSYSLSPEENAMVQGWLHTYID